MNVMSTFPYPLHPACAAWDAMNETELQELAESIRANGLDKPVTITQDGQMLDGKNRQAACAMAGVTLRVETYEGDDPIGFTVRCNKERKHYTAAQLALIGATLANLKNGSNQFRKKEGFRRENPLPKARTQKQVAEDLGINSAMISKARTLEENAEPHVIEAVRSGDLSLDNAYDYARVTPREIQRTDNVVAIKAKSAGRAMRQAAKVIKTDKPAKATKTAKPLKPTGLRRGVLYQLKPVNHGGEPLSTDHPVHIFPQSIERLHNVGVWLTVIAGMVKGIDDRIVSAGGVDAFVEGVQAMLAHKVVVGGKTGADTDWARHARKDLKTFAASIEATIAALAEIKRRLIDAEPS
jgi:hypothetical protein